MVEYPVESASTPEAVLDVVVVSYNSASVLQQCLSQFATVPEVRVIVVDNASSDSSRDLAADLGARVVELRSNRGFASACNAGWRLGSAPYVLFLNPDACIDADSAAELVRILDRYPQIGVVGPLIRSPTGDTVLSQRRFPSVTRSLSEALFLHRILPSAGWTGQLVTDRNAYAKPGSPDWLSGACLAIRRNTLEVIGGWDERFFLYREDVDLCRRVRSIGLGVRYDPTVSVTHVGGHAAGRAAVLPILVRSRLVYARKYGGRSGEMAERFACALGALTHFACGSGDRSVRRGHLRALMAAATMPGRQRS